MYDLIPDISDEIIPRTRIVDEPVDIHGDGRIDNPICFEEFSSSPPPSSKWAILFRIYLRRCLKNSGSRPFPTISLAMRGVECPIPLAIGTLGH